MTTFVIPWHPTARTLRQFAGLWLVFVGLLAWRFGLPSGQIVGVVLAVLALSVGIAGLIWPLWVRPLFVALTVATLPLGWVVSNGILLVLFYGLFTPISLIFRLVGRDVLERSFRPDRDSYWEPKAQPADVARYFRTF